MRAESRGAAALLVILAAVLVVSPAEGAVALEVFSAVPAFADFATAGQQITLKGIGFTSSTSVLFDSAPASAVTRVDSRTLLVTVPTVASARLSTLHVSDPANGSDTFFPFFHTGPVYYVAKTGADNNLGTSPGSPKLTIAAALAALSGTTPTEVRVGPGVFAENQLVLPYGAVLTCGWAPGFTSRDPETHYTDLDGMGTNYIIRTGGFVTPAAVDGCTLRNGLRDGFGGGAVPIIADSPVINNNVFVGNTSTAYGGAIYFSATTTYGGRVTISNNVLVGNKSGGRGGGGVGIYTDDNNQQSVRITLSGNQIVGNRAYRAQGGGAAVMSSGYGGYTVIQFSAADNQFLFNSSLSGGGIDLTLLNVGDIMNLTANNNLVASNRSDGGGGGFSIQGLGLFDGTVKSSTIWGNAGQYQEGGGLVISDSINPSSNLTVTDLIVWGNFGGEVLGQGLTRTTYSDTGTPVSGVGNVSIDPAFKAGPLGDFYLRQSDPNGPDSPALNSGSAQASALSVENLTTKTDLSADAGMGDMGFHYPRAGTPSPAAITFSRVDPNFGDINGGDWVLIRGRGFDPGVGVSFDGIPAEKVTYVSSTRILAQPARHSAAVVNVRVTNPDATFSQINGVYRYTDTQPPLWSTTVGLIAATTEVDCVRSVVLDWNEATDNLSPPVLYDVYRVPCDPPVNQFTPCANFGFVPSTAQLLATTPDTFYVDLDHPVGATDPKWIYNVRARDSASPPNREFNFGKRVSLATKITTDTIAPEPVGPTLRLISATQLDWDGAGGAVSYGVYRTTSASQYLNPGSIPKLALLTRLNNDLNGDGITDTTYTDAATPPPGGLFFYRISAIDPCNVENTNELLP